MHKMVGPLYAAPFLSRCVIMTPLPQELVELLDLVTKDTGRLIPSG
jgi:hypothetical protein